MAENTKGRKYTFREDIITSVPTWTLIEDVQALHRALMQDHDSLCNQVGVTIECLEELIANYTQVPDGVSITPSGSSLIALGIKSGIITFDDGEDVRCAGDKPISHAMLGGVCQCDESCPHFEDCFENGMPRRGRILPLDMPQAEMVTDDDIVAYLDGCTGGEIDVPKEDRGIIRRTFGSLYFDGQPVDVGARYAGQALTLGNRAPGQEITWVYVNGMYVADRCLCIKISWDQLNKLGLVYGKEFTIDGNRYLCRLLKVGGAPGDPNEWDSLLDATSEDDSLWHWSDALLWGQETSGDYRAVRGWVSARSWNYYYAAYRDVDVGFRPALIPLGTDSLTSETTNREDIDAGCPASDAGITVKTFGSLYFDGQPVDTGSVYDGQRLTIGNGTPGQEITWVRVNGMYVADHCLCTDVSWDQLNEMGLVHGKEMTIDGSQYLCRILKMGASPEEPNEWDTALDATSEDDSLWHWSDAFFWEQETSEKWTPLRAVRGWASARFWYRNYASTRSVSIGFRPALIPLGTAPLISETTSRDDIDADCPAPDAGITVKTFGSLYFDGQPVDVGTRYARQALAIGDGALGQEITWVYVNGMYVANHCLCTDISWHQLNEMGLVNGKEFTIDGKRYLCRLLKVGAAPGEPNEWDAALDATTEDDRLWHWSDAIFLGQETSKSLVSGRAVRSWMSARYWGNLSATYRSMGVGFRPVLIPLGADSMTSETK